MIKGSGPKGILKGDVLAYISLNNIMEYLPVSPSFPTTELAAAAATDIGTPLPYFKDSYDLALDRQLFFSREVVLQNPISRSKIIASCTEIINSAVGPTTIIDRLSSPYLYESGCLYCADGEKLRLSLYASSHQQFSGNQDDLLNDVQVLVEKASEDYSFDDILGISYSKEASIVKDTENNLDIFDQLSSSGDITSFRIEMALDPLVIKKEEGLALLRSIIIQ